MERRVTLLEVDAKHGGMQSQDEDPSLQISTATLREGFQSGTEDFEETKVEQPKSK